MRALLVHGAGGGAWEWRIWQAVFAARGSHSEAVELQPAAEGLAATRLADYVEQVRAGLERIERPRAVVGASLGGLLAALVADAADALVLVNPLPPAPWAAALPHRHWPAVVPWGCNARLRSTFDAMRDADAGSVLHAFRAWRDESGAVLQDAHAGVPGDRPCCPVLCVISTTDEDVPPAVSGAYAHGWQADILRVASTSHVGPLLGRAAASTAESVAAWLSAR